MSTFLLNFMGEPYMDSMLVKELSVAQTAALKAGKILQKAFTLPKRITMKSTETDPVTESDIACQKIIVAEIKKFFPHHNIIGEENLHQDQASEYTWYLDPIDGTVNFTHGFAWFSVSIGLKKGNEPFVGVVYAPLLNEMFYAVKGKGAFLTHPPPSKTEKTLSLNVSSTPTLMQSLVVSGFPYHKHINPDNNVKEFCRVITHIQGFRRTGSAALDMCYLAAGRFDGYWELFLKPWDYTAAALIVQEAGGTITNTEGLPLDYVGSRVVATNGKIHKELLTLLQIPK